MRMPRRGKRWASLVAVFYALLLAGMSLRPVGDGAVDSAVNSLGRGYLHLPAYAVFGALLTAALRPGRRGARWAFAAAVVYGAALELGQIGVPTRHFNWLGIGLNTAGAGIGCLTAAWIGDRVGRRRGEGRAARDGEGSPREDSRCGAQDERAARGG